jgi:hypothetical protein
MDMGAIKALRALLGLILCLVLGVSVWLTVQGQVFHQEETAVAGMIFRPVEESSLEPTLTGGDLAVIQPREEYAMGEIVLCQEEEKDSFLLLAGTNGENFIVQEKDEETQRLLSPEAIRGKVVAALPGAGTVYEFLGSWWGAPVILVVGILLLALPTLLGVRKPSRRASAEEISTEERPAVEKTVREKSGRYKSRHGR